MKVNFKPTFLFLSLVLIVIACNSGNDLGKMTAVEKAATTKDVQAVLQEYVNGQYNYLTKQTDAAWTNLVEDKNKDVLQKQIDDYKSTLAAEKLSYTAYTSQVTIDSTQFDGDSVVAFATDVYTMISSDRDPADTSSFIVTKGIYRYRASFVKKDNKWVIRNFHCPDVSRFAINPSPQTLEEPSVPLKENITLTYTYNPTRAKEYANRFWKDGNSEYCDFTDPNGDCTNFLSQCLYTGGWPQDKVWHAKLKSNCPTCRNSSCDAMECYGCRWTVAQDFKYYITHEASGRVEKKSAASDLEIGDIIQYDYEDDNKIDHNTIVTSKVTVGGVTRVRVAYRTSSGERNEPAYDKPYNEVSSTAKCLFWKVK